MRETPVGLWLKARCSRLGYSMEGLARLAGLNRRTLTRIAAGGRVTRRTAQALAAPLRLPPEAVDALARPDVTPAELDALAGVLKFLVFYLGLDLASVAIRLAAG